MARGPAKQFDPEEALKKAMKLFWARGYAATGMTELQSAMGIGRKSLYDTFGNKRQLFIKALQLYSDTFVKQLRDDLNKEGSALENIRGVMRQLESANCRAGSFGCLFGVSMAQFTTEDAEMATILRGHMKGLEQGFYDALKRAQDDDEISDRVSARDLARLFMSTTQGLALVGRVVETAAIPKSIVKAALSVLEAA